MYLLFFFNDTATTEIYTLSLHDALPIYRHATEPAIDRHRLSAGQCRVVEPRPEQYGAREKWDTAILRGSLAAGAELDPKSTRLDSSQQLISYYVFCLKKKKIMPHLGSRH